MNVLIVTKQFSSHGGATIASALIVQALLELNLDVTVLCLTSDALEHFKRNLDIDFDKTRLKIVKLDRKSNRLLGRSGYLDSLFLMKAAKRREYQQHIAFSVWDEMDLGRTSLQYIYWPSHHPAAISAAQLNVHGRLTEHMAKWYRVACKGLMGFSQKRVVQNFSVFSSRFSRQNFLKYYKEVPGDIVYPPLLISPQFIKSFADREDGFVYSGRVAPDKNIHHMIEFVHKLRADGAGLHFHVVGPAVNEGYLDQLREEYPFDWVTFEGKRTRIEVSKILGDHKYSIQGRFNEPFGMAAGESCRMGCLTFVPSNSGLAELLLDDCLKFDSFPDLYERFTQLLHDNERQQRLSDALTAQFAEFTVEKFQAQIQRFFLGAASALNGKQPEITEKELLVSD